MFCLIPYAKFFLRNCKNVFNIFYIFGINKLFTVMQNKVLSLDLGISSIGWALVSLPVKDNKPEESSMPSEQAKIIAMGVKIIPLDSKDEKGNFEQGKAIQTNQHRTMKRQMRRGYARYKKRRIALKKALATANMLDETLIPLEKLQLWELRAKAVQEKVSLTELGRIILHLNQKRGYNQNLKGQIEAEENTDNDNNTTSQKQSKKESYKDTIEKNSRELQGKTIGQVVYQELLKDPDYRTKGITYYRTDYQKEFDTIMNTQKNFYPEILTEEYIQKIREIIYYQRPLKSQKGLIKLCSFAEKIKTIPLHEQDKGNPNTTENSTRTIKVGPRVAPKSSPLAEYKKILQTVNNLKIKEFEKIAVEDDTPEDTESKKKSNKKKRYEKIISKFELNSEQRQKLINALQDCEKMKKNEIITLLGYSSNRYAIDNFDEIDGNKTRTKIIAILGREHPALQFNLVKDTRTIETVDQETGEITRVELEQISPEVEKEPFYQLWHIIYSIKDIEECKNALIKRFHFDEETAAKLAKIEFTKGNNDFTNMSAKVMRHIIPYLEQGRTYDEAMEIAGYKHSKESRTTQEKMQRTLKDTLDLIPRNALRQPVVEKILNQMIHIVNEVINPERGWVSKEERENGTFRIHIELARELKSSAKERAKVHKKNIRRKDDNESIIKILKGKSITPSRNNIIRYRLFRGDNTSDKNSQPEAKTNAICMYSGKTFEFNQVFDDKIVDKDHIIPQSLYPDDSQGNFVLVYKAENQRKGNRTAYDYMFSKGEEEFNKYIQRIQDSFSKNALTGTQVRNLLTTLEHNPQEGIHSTVEITSKNFSIKVRKLDEDSGFAARDLRETSYITREARRILQDICREVLPTTGAVTSTLRRLWGYDDILLHWHLENIQDQREVQHLIEKKTITEQDGQKTEKNTIKDWSKRDDHRHHAIDALVVACTSRSMIQRINTLHNKSTRKQLEAEIENKNSLNHNHKQTLLNKWLTEQRIFSYEQVKNHADNILISYKPGKKVASWTKNKIGRKWDKTLKRTLTPRGELHEESYYGKIQVSGSKKVKKIEKIIEDLDKLNYISKNDREAIFNDKNVQYYLEHKDNQGLIKYLKKTKKITEYTIIEPSYRFVKRYSITEIDITKQENKFPDKKTVSLLKDCFDPKDKIKNKEKENQESSSNQSSQEDILSNSLKIKAVRKFVTSADDNKDTYEPIRFNSDGQPITFVKPGNNHHIAIYKDKQGKFYEHICTFWHAVQRKKYSVPVVITSPQQLHETIADKNLPEFITKKLPNAEWEYVLSMQLNEMFIFRMSKNEVEQAIQTKNYTTIIKNLYRVQKLSSRDYTFRHHLATSVDDKNEYTKLQRISVKSIGALEKLNPIKLSVNRLGEITRIIETIPSIKI